MTALLLVSALVFPAAFSGCLTSVAATKDWWGGNGGLRVEFGTLPADAPGQEMREFSTLKVAVTAVLVNPVGELQYVAASAFNPAFGVDLKTRYDDGKGKVLLERESIPTKAIKSVEAKLFLVEAKDNAGNAIPACPTERGVEKAKPCFAMPKGGSFILDKSADPIQMPRAKTTSFFFPLAVIYDAKTEEYFLQARSAASEAPVTFS